MNGIFTPRIDNHYSKVPLDLKLKNLVLIATKRSLRIRFAKSKQLQVTDGHMEALDWVITGS